MALTADDIWDKFILEEDVPDLTPSIKYEWIDFLNQELYHAMVESDPIPYISEATIPVGSIAYTLTGIVGTPAVGATATGATSGATGTVYSFVTPVLTIQDIDGAFEDGEVITIGAASGTVDSFATATYFDLPDDFEEIIPNGCGFFLYNSDGRVDQELTPYPNGSYYDGYFIDNVNGRVWITGSPTVDTWTLRYIPRKTEITAGTQNLVIPDRLKHKCKRIFFHALSEMYKMRDERSMGDIQPDQIYKSTYFNEFVKLFKPTTKNVVLRPFQGYHNSRSRYYGHRYR